MADPLETLHVEASCSVCLEFLQDPVLIDCGHNFCRACITRWWEGLEGSYPCPVCRKSSRRRRFRPNRQLGNMAEAARQLRAMKRKAGGVNGDGEDEEGEGRCEEHGRPLSRFCMEEMKVVCAQCEVTCVNGQHQLMGLQEAARHGKERLQRCMEPLEQQLLDLQQQRAQEDGKHGEIRRSVSSHRLRISAEFEELHRLLEEEEQQLQRRLQDEESSVLLQLRRNAMQLLQRRNHLQQLLRYLQDKCMQEGMRLLQDLPALLARCEEAASHWVPPPPVPIALQHNFLSFPRQYFTLRRMARSMLGDITLDPDTAHPNLVLSADRKSVRFVSTRQLHLPVTERRFTSYPCVLATRGFTSGRHYWEVEVGRKTHWALGVCGDSVCRNGEMAAGPQSGFWRVRLWNGDRYAATTNPFTPITPRVAPTRVGVFVDYEAGEVSFYNVTDRSHLFTFNNGFKEKIWPLFYPGIPAGRKNAAPLTICQPTDWD